MDWFKGNFTGKPHYLNGKIDGFTICISFSKRKPMDFRSFFSAIAAIASRAGGEAHLRLTDQHCKLAAGLPTRNSDTLNDKCLLIRISGKLMLVNQC